MVRKMTVADRAAYLAMAGEFYASDAVHAPIPAERFSRTFDEAMRSDRYVGLYMLETEGGAVGYALTARTYQQEAGGEVVWLDEIYVRPEGRSRGLGREFLAYIAERSGAARLRLEVAADNVRAKALYAAMGYEELPYEQMYRQLEP